MWNRGLEILAWRVVAGEDSLAKISYEAIGRRPLLEIDANNLFERTF